MLKKLLTFAAVAAVGLCANAQNHSGLALNDLDADASESEATTYEYIYVTGGSEAFGNWDLANALAVAGEDNVFTFNTSCNFKFSTTNADNWADFNTGALSAGQMLIGENPLTVSDFDNTLPTAGEYEVVVDLNNMILTLNLIAETEPQVVDIYLRGEMNGWGADSEYLFSTEDGVIYTLAGVSIEAGQQFKFASEDWSTVDLGGASDMVVNTVYTLTFGGFNCTVAESVSDVTIVLNIEDNSVELRSSEPVSDTYPYIYVTGGSEAFGNWDPANALAVAGEDNVFTFNTSCNFKFSTTKADNWEDFNTGALSAGQMQVGENELTISDRDNALPNAGEYEVVVDLNNMILTLNLIAEPEPQILDIYLRGGMNGWGADSEYLFSTEDGVIYTLAGVSIEAGEEFKFATEDWSTVNLGSASDMVVNTVYYLEYNGFNCTVAESVSDATIVLNIEDNSVVLSTTTGVANIETEAAEAIYYNLQGVQVANPSNGIYLKRVGNKVSKVMVK